MRLYGTLQELSSLTIRLDSGKTVQVVAAEPTVSATVTIPDVVDGADTFVVADTAQLLLNKSLTAPQITQVNLQDSVRIDVPVAATTTQAESGSLKFNSSTKNLTIGDGTATRVLVDDGALDDGLSSSQRPLIRNKRLTQSNIESTSFTGGSIGSDSSPTAIDYVNKIGLSDIPDVSANHVLISDANNELFSEAQLNKSRGGTGADLSNVLFPGNDVPSTIQTNIAELTSVKLDRALPEIATNVLTPSSDKAVIQRIDTAGNFNEIANPEDGRYYILMNASATDITIGNETGTAANQIVTGTGAAFTFKAGTSIAAVYDGGSTKWRLSGGAGGAGGGTADVISQVAHGFVVGDALYLSGSTYTKAIATAANTAEVVGVVSKVVSSDTFELTTSGEITNLSGLTPGGVYFLSSVTAGLLTLTEPSVVGHVSLPIGVASSASSLYVAPKRGVVVGAANARTTIAVSNNAATNVVDVTSYNSLKLEGELNVTRSSGGNHRAYYTVEAAKNGAGVWQVSASYTGDDVLYTTLPSWDVAANQLQVTMPNVTNFSSASLTYALGAPAVGASLPLSIDSSSINIVESAPLSNRNRIINGDCLVAQRGSVAVVNNAVTYGGADRIYVAPFSFTTLSGTIQRGAFNEGVAGYGQVLNCTTTGSGVVIFGQRIESLNTVDLKSKTVTFSGTLYQDTGSTVVVDVKMYKANAVDDFSGSTQLGSTATVSVPSGVATNFTLTVTLGSTDATNGMAVDMTFKDIGAVTNKLFIVSNLQLEVGSKATAFERRPYGTELALCQRYYYKVAPDGSNYLFFGWAKGYSVSNLNVVINHPVPLRAKAATLDLTALNTYAWETGATLGNTPTTITIDGQVSNFNSTCLGVAKTSAFTAGAMYWFIANNTTTASIGIGAEL